MTDARLEAALDCANDAEGGCALRPPGDAHACNGASPYAATSCGFASRPAKAGRDARPVMGATPPADALVVAWGHACFHTPVPSPRGSLPSIDPYGKVVTAMRWPTTLVLGGLAAVAVIARALRAPFGTVILADLGSRVDLVERSVRRSEGDPRLADALKRDARGEWE